MNINTLEASRKYLCKSHSSARHMPLLLITSSPTQPDELPEVTVDEETTKAVPGGTTAEHISKIFDVTVSSPFTHTRGGFMMSLSKIPLCTLLQISA